MKGISRRALLGSGAATGLFAAGPLPQSDTPVNGARHRLLMRYPAARPASSWLDALPSGNGRYGAAVYGNVQRERILLNHEDLWDYAEATRQPDVSALLPEARRLLLAGKRWEANDLYINRLKELDYRVRLGALLPLADLLLTTAPKLSVRDYRRELDMATGEVLVAWSEGETRFERRVFVSRTEDVVVCEIRASAPGAIRVRAELVVHDLKDVRVRPGRSAQTPKTPQSWASGEFLMFTAKTQSGGDFGAVARVIASGGNVGVQGSAIEVDSGDRVVILIRAFARGETAATHARLRDELAAIPADYVRLFAPHAKAHGELFHRVRLDLGASDRERSLSNEQVLLNAYGGDVPTVLVEKMWAYGRYLFISSTRPGGQPPCLLGKWCGDYEGFWTFNMANINIQMIYWQVMAGNLAELNPTLFDYYESMLDQFRENARKIFGCRGILVPAPTTPGFGAILGSTGHILFWTGGAAWLAAHYYDHYRFTGDEKFLRRRALPFMREAALFYEDFTVEDEAGHLMFAPSNSPENAPGGYTDRSRSDGQQQISINATMDIALAKELLTNLVEAAAKTGMYAAEAARWKAMLSKLPPYQVNADGAVREWTYPGLPEHYEHRHLSHLYAAFPGNEIGRDHELYPAFRNASDIRLSRGMSFQSGWSLMHHANLLARWRDGAAAHAVLARFARSCIGPNFFGYHNDWRGSGLTLGAGSPPFQIDGNMGWTSAVQEMLLASEIGRVSLLPALAPQWTRGEIAGLRCREGITASIRWNIGAKSVEATLRSDRDQKVDIRFPARIVSVSRVRTTADGNEIRALSLPAGRDINLNAKLDW